MHHCYWCYNWLVDEQHSTQWICIILFLVLIIMIKTDYGRHLEWFWFDSVHLSALQMHQFNHCIHQCLRAECEWQPNNKQFDLSLCIVLKERERERKKTFLRWSALFSFIIIIVSSFVCIYICLYNHLSSFVFLSLCHFNSPREFCFVDHLTAVFLFVSAFSCSFATVFYLITHCSFYFILFVLLLPLQVNQEVTSN